MAQKRSKRLHQKLFSVVEFPSEKAVEFVPTIWIEQVNRENLQNVHQCYWPPKGKLESFRKNITPPCPGLWSTVPCRLLESNCK